MLYYFGYTLEDIAEDILLHCWEQLLTAQDLYYLGNYSSTVAICMYTLVLCATEMVTKILILIDIDKRSYENMNLHRNKSFLIHVAEAYQRLCRFLNSNHFDVVSILSKQCLVHDILLVRWGDRWKLVAQS